jgi:hypothetical protein
MRWSLFAFLAACSFSAHPGNTGDDVKIDAAVDAPPDAPPDAYDPLCFAGGAFYTCLPTMPTGMKILPADIDTTTCLVLTSQKRMIGTVEVCAIEGDTIQSNATVSVHGSRPLALFAHTSITLGGNIDASSVRANLDRGPGANPTTCTAVNGTANAAGGGGGAGGTFSTKGGNGGNGGGATGTLADDAVAPPFNTLRGGCRGGDGQGVTRVGGDGGGAVFLAAHQTININAIIDVSGAAGFGGETGKNGGAGAGSGGMIVIHAATVTLQANAKLVANGGGGGGGAGVNTAGANGSEVNGSMPALAAPGGDSNGGMGGACDGGRGGAQGIDALPGANNANGAGGGGGGVGVIRILGGLANLASIPATTASPTPTK